MEYGEAPPFECFQTRGDCAYPAPAPIPSLRPLWNVFADSADCVKRAGLDGEFDGYDMGGVAIIAAAHGEPFDPTFLRRWRVLSSAQRLQAARKRASRPK